MPGFGMNTTKRKGSVPRPGSSSGDAGHSATEIGSTMLRSAAAGAVQLPSVAVAYSTATQQAMAPLGDATVFEVRRVALVLEVEVFADQTWRLAERGLSVCVAC